LRDDEVIAYFLLEETARSLSGTPVQGYLEGALSKLSSMLPLGGGLTLADISQAMSLRLERAPAKAAQPETLTKICHAIQARKQLQITYRDGKHAETTRRRIDPLHLTRCEGQWYLMAYCRLRKALRTFVPARITKLELRRECFEPPMDFDPAAHFRRAFGIVSDEETTSVELVFESEVAHYIAERNWHPTQTIEALGDGRVRVKLTCCVSQELQRWLLGWGASVSVVYPKSLKKMIEKEHASASQ
jgi:predicted DNA-binding transcriptional regulator YafY